MLPLSIYMYVYPLTVWFNECSYHILSYVYVWYLIILLLHVLLFELVERYSFGRCSTKKHSSVVEFLKSVGK